MVKIKFLSQNKFSSLNQFDLFGSNETGCIYIRENNYNRKLLSSDLNGNFSIGGYNGDTKLTINDVNGQCLKIINNNDKNATINIDNNGSLNLNCYSNIVKINTLSLVNQLQTQYGGTGNSNYYNGDILIGDNNNSLSKLSIPINGNNQLLLSSIDNGVYWG